VSDSLRIAVFVNAFPVASETFILRQITGLIDLGHDVHIFANTRGDQNVVHESIKQYQLLERTTFVDGPPESVVWEMPVRPVTGETWPPGAEHSVPNVSRLAHAFERLTECAQSEPRLTRRIIEVRKYGYRAQSLSGVYRLATLLKSKRQFDILHAHFGPVAESFRFAPELFQAPLAVSFHGYDFCTTPRKEGRDVYRRLWSAAHGVIANSYYTRHRLLGLNCPENIVTVLPVGLNPTDFSFQERTLRSDEPARLLTVARLVEIKGHEYVLRALAQLRQRHPNLRYDIVGDGPLKKKLTTLSTELGLDDVVAFHGTRSESEVREFFARAHLFALTSVSLEGDEEGQGLVLQEAQACGLPIVATRHGAFPEGIAPEYWQWLVPERNAGALAENLHDMISAREQWPALGRAGRAFVEGRYDMRTLNPRLVEIYRRCMDAYQM
jgi:colanic acid/amylovoran biosynthesis glycosyltransferase